MVTFSPPAFPLDGTEGIPLNVSGRGGTVTLAQLRQIVRGQPIGAGAPNPPAGQPAVTAISGTEQLRVMSGATGGCGIATVDQLIAWITTGTASAFALPANGAGWGLRPVTALDGGDGLFVRQDAGVRAATLATIRDFLTA
jgi:hypothetical protein